MTDEAEAERIRAMIYDVSFKDQQKIRNAEFSDEQDSFVLLSALLQCKQIHAFLDEDKQGTEKIKDWQVSRFDVEEAGMEVVGLIHHVDDPDVRERLLTALYGDARH